MLPASLLAALPLGERHKEWLETEVVYIISDREREVFTQLTTEELRDQFVEMFWQQRDPTPATSYNEFKEEHYRRLAYVNTWFGSRKKKDGWRSDRGRVYILFGEPKEKVKFTGENDVRDCEIWFIDAQGLVTGFPYFRLLFYQKTFAHDFVLYSPTHDGPQELAMQIAPTREQALNYIFERSGQQLWEAAQSYIPTEPLGGNWSAQSEILISKIENMRNTLVNSAWADSFLVTKGRVSTRLSFRNLNLSQILRTYFDLQKNAFLHVGFGIRSEDLKVGEIDGRYFAIFDIRTFIEDAATGREVVSRTDHWESRFELQGGQVLAKPLAFQQVFPLVPGKYRLLWVIDDLISETFSFRQDEIVVPDPSSVSPELSLPLLSSRYQSLDRNAAAELHPFRIFNLQYSPEYWANFNRGDDLNVFFQYLFDEKKELPDEVRFDISLHRTGGGNGAPIVLEHKVPRERLGSAGILFVHRQLPVTQLEVGEYDLEVRAYADSQPTATSQKVRLRYRGEEVQVRPRPDELISPLHFSSPQFVLERARQFETTGRREEAVATLRKAIEAGMQETVLGARLKELEAAATPSVP